MSGSPYRHMHTTDKQQPGGGLPGYLPSTETTQDDRRRAQAAADALPTRSGPTFLVAQHREEQEADHDRTPSWPVLSGGAAEDEVKKPAASDSFKHKAMVAMVSAAIIVFVVGVVQALFHPFTHDKFWTYYSVFTIVTAAGIGFGAWKLGMVLPPWSR